MFCSECGNEIVDRSVLFCPECGTRVEWEDEVVETAGTTEVPAAAGSPAVEDVHVPVENEQKSMDYEFTGIIFTNMDLLAEHMSVDRRKVSDLLDSFVRQRRKAGIAYRVVDAGNYTYRKRGFLGIPKTVRLGLKSTLWEYMDVLMDAHDPDAEEIELMFIIGGDNIIPMPCIAHYVQDPDGDQDIDADLVYSYPYGQDMAQAIASQSIFTYDPLYHVGRFPLAEDAGYNELKSYLDRVNMNPGGVPLNYAYGQTDPNWKMVSSLVSGTLKKFGFFPDFSGRISSDRYLNGLILSPMITSRDVERVFNDKAAIYYFNMHGSNGYENSGYYGELPDKSGCYEGIYPGVMASCKNPNIVFSEACYGGRFIDFDTAHSMMQSSLYTNTMAFVGSSRVAWGNVDHGATSIDQVSPSCADILANAWFFYMLQGATAAEALYMARAILLNTDELGNPYNGASVMEFNLYGDPSVKLRLEEEHEDHKKDMKATLVTKGSRIGCTVKKISDNSNTSVLDMVRGAVDSNLKQIRSMVDDYLYANFKVSPRQLSGIFSMEYASGTKELFFNYNLTEDDREIKSKLIVSTGEDGNIRKIIASK